MIKLKRKDLKFVFEGETYGLQHIDLFLSNRKGWQRRLDKGNVEADLRSEFHLECLYSYVPVTNLNFTTSHQAITISSTRNQTFLLAMHFIGSTFGSSISKMCIMAGPSTRKTTFSRRWVLME